MSLLGEHCADALCAHISSATDIKALICNNNICANLTLKMEGWNDHGYARVSTDGQSLEAQHAALLAPLPRPNAVYLLQAPVFEKFDE
jgi:hypothetical protein